MQLITQNECIEYIHSLSRFGKKSGLDNIKSLCNYLGNPQDKLKFVHVAGTNGKGSLCAMLTGIFKRKYKVGLYVSPYIEEFNERIQINGKNIEPNDLVKYTNTVKNAVEDLGITPIEFEFITAMGFLYFADKCCDFVVIETGLGGRLDSTNIIKNPILCVITAIGLDHVSILGDTIEQIAKEKAGIIKPNSNVVIYKKQAKDAVFVIKDTCKNVGATLSNNDGIYAQNISCTLEGTQFEYKGENYVLEHLLGEYQVDNAITVIDAAKEIINTFPVTDEDIKQGLKETSWKCRFEVFKKGDTTVIIDGAHNSHGIQGFLNSIKKLSNNKKITFVFGMLNEKDYSESIRQICSLDGDIIVTDVPSIRQTDAKAVFDCVKNYRSNAVYIENPKKAVEYALDTSKEGLVCIFGSLYLCGEIRKYIK